MSAVDLLSSRNLVLLNPKMPESDASRMKGLLSAVLPEVKSHVFIASSGTTAASVADLKWVALSKEAILAGAESANGVLASNASDVWLHALPDFHIGGLAIHARALQSGAEIVSLQGSPWNPELYCAQAREHFATLSSLVPAQVHDLVRLGLTAPGSMRAILVGGGALSEALYLKARALGWPLLPTYGMTEAASQVATAELATLNQMPGRSPALRLLEHLDARTDSEERLSLSGSSLLSFYVWAEQGRAVKVDPKKDGWFLTEDCGMLQGRNWAPSGRLRDRIKIGGELTHLGRLNGLFENLRERLEASLGVSAVLTAAPDERLGSVVHLVHESSDESGRSRIESLAREFDSRVLPFERIRAIRSVERIDRTELGKPKL